MEKIKVLLADDDLIFLRLISNFLHGAGYEVCVASSVAECIQKLSTDRFDVILQDMCYPALDDGFGMLEHLHESYPDLPVIMISGSGHIPDAVTAIKKGALDFIEKPIDTNHLLHKLKMICDSIILSKQMQELQITAIGMCGSSKPMMQLFADIIRAANYDCPVLITGETGVGKELAAHAIHRLSKHGNKNMLSINCASVPKDLFEAELFGYERGAFTGADKPRQGYFEFADNNSFFMDEISQLPMAMQAKLLRVVSEGEVQKLGGRVIKVNTRVISASNQDLMELAEQGNFRKDLYYRLNTIHIQVPPLRDRLEDIPDLADHFMAEFCSRNNIPPKKISPTAKAWLCEQKWEGNVRELKNMVERGVIFAKNDHLTVVDFTTALINDFKGQKSGSLRSVLSSFEKAFIENTLKEHEYNIRQTAQILQMDKSNLFKKIASLGIVIPHK